MAEQQTVIVEGTIKNAYQKKNNDGVVVNIVNFVPDNIAILDKIKAFEGVPAKYIPKWYKDPDGHIMLKSKYNIKVKNTDDEKMSFVEWLDTEKIQNAKAKVSWNEKPGALYPVAIRILEDGEEIDYFAGM